MCLATNLDVTISFSYLWSMVVRQSVPCGDGGRVVSRPVVLHPIGCKTTELWQMTGPARTIRHSHLRMPVYYAPILTLKSQVTSSACSLSVRYWPSLSYVKRQPHC